MTIDVNYETRVMSTSEQLVLSKGMPMVVPFVLKNQSDHVLLRFMICYRETVSGNEQALYYSLQRINGSKMSVWIKMQAKLDNRNITHLELKTSERNHNWSTMDLSDFVHKAILNDSFSIWLHL